MLRLQILRPRNEDESSLHRGIVIGDTSLLQSFDQELSIRHVRPLFAVITTSAKGSVGRFDAFAFIPLETSQEILRLLDHIVKPTVRIGFRQCQNRDAGFVVLMTTFSGVNSARGLLLRHDEVEPLFHHGIVDTFAGHQQRRCHEARDSDGFGIRP